MDTEPIILKLTPEEASNKIIMQLYMAVGTRLGYQSDSDHVYFDCRKINVADNIQENLIATYRGDGALFPGASLEEAGKCINQILLLSGPKVNKSLPDNTVEIMPGFVQAEDGAALTPAQSYRYGAFIRDFSTLPEKDSVLAWIEGNGSDDRAMAELREKYEQLTGCDPTMLYPHYDGRFLGGNMLPVREGILYVPYSAQEPNDFEIYEPDCAVLLDAEACRKMIEASECAAAELSRTLKRVLTITTLQENARAISGEVAATPEWMPLQYMQRGDQNE